MVKLSESCDLHTVGLLVVLQNSPVQQAWLKLRRVVVEVSAGGPAGSIWSLGEEIFIRRSVATGQVSPVHLQLNQFGPGKISGQHESFRLRRLLKHDS